MKMKNGDIKIRGLDLDVIARLDQMAKDRNMSREKFLRNVLTNLSIQKEMNDQKEQYQMLMKQIIDINAQVLQELHVIDLKVTDLADKE